MRKSAPRHTKLKVNRSKLRRALFWSGFLFLISGFIAFAFWWRQGWNGKEPVNVIVSVGDRFWVLAVRPDEKRLTEIEIPPNVIVPVNGGLAGEEAGRWQARALWELSQLEGGTEIIKAIGWELLEIPIDSVVRLETWKSRQTSYPRRWIGSEELRLFRYIRSLNEGQITRVNLAELSGVRRVVDPGGTELIEVDQELLSAQLTGWFQIGQMRQEGFAVAIRDTSDVTGAGAKLARQLEHSGGRVVAVESGDGESGLLVGNQANQDSLTVKKLSKWLGIKPRVAEFEERADILIVQ